jgi:hypothetical protein
MKLSKMGITGIAYEWFKSYLSDRSQVVDINGVPLVSLCSTCQREKV